MNIAVREVGPWDGLQATTAIMLADVKVRRIAA